MDAIRKKLFWLSKTDRDIIGYCPETVRETQLAMGMAVLFTAVLAFFSGAYAIQTVFHSTVIAVVIGAIYSLIILNIDREIVSVPDKAAALLRLPLAIIIGIVISVPIELKIFEDRIDQELQRQSKKENQDAFNSVKDIDDKYQEQKKGLEKDIRKRRELIDEYIRNMEAESVGRPYPGRTGIPGQGTAYYASRTAKEYAEKQLEQTQVELEQLKKNYSLEMTRARTLYNERKVEQTFGLLSRMEALEDIKQNSPAAFGMAWGVRIFFILIEIMPALIKLFRKNDEYTSWLETRTSVNKQRIYGIGNDQIDELENDPKKRPDRTLKEQLIDFPLTS